MSIDNSKLLLQDISQLYNDTNNHDIKIIVGKDDHIETFKAHSIILRIRSNYFNEILSNNWTKNENNIILPNINPRIFKIILKYFYNGDYSIDDSYIIELLVAAHELGLTELVTQIQMNFIHNKCNWLQQNFVLIYNAAFKCGEFKIFLDYCEELMCAQHELLFESPNFTSIEKPLLISIIKKDDLALEEIKIWNYVIKWGMEQKPQVNSKISELTQEDYTKLKNRLHGLLQHIRFFTICFDDFWNVIWPLRKLLSNDFLDKLVDHNNHQISPRIDSLSRRISKKLSNSNIINYRQANFILNWLYNWLYDKEDDKIDCKLHAVYKLELMHRGSRDGMDLNTFYKFCNKRHNMIIVMKLKESEKIIGGYNPRSWKSRRSSWANTDGSFIFSFDSIRSDTHIFSKVKYSDHAIVDFSNTIGFGDLIFLPYRYYNQVYYEKKIIETAGFFDIEDYEVFRILCRDWNKSKFS